MLTQNKMASKTERKEGERGEVKKEKRNVKDQNV